MSSFLPRPKPSGAAPLEREILICGRAFVISKSIAEGGFGFISQVTDTTDGRVYVLKKAVLQTPESAQTAQTEIQCLQKLQHPHIVRYLVSETIQTGRHPEACIVMEYCPGGHLMDWLNSRQGRRLNIGEILDVFVQVVSAVRYMHTRPVPVVHRDLKLENILRSVDGSFKLCDFGSCVEGHVPLRSSLERAEAEEIIQRTTTQMYRAPEMCDLYMVDLLTEKTDIWALGCIMYSLCFLTHPFQNAGNLGIINAKIHFPTDSRFSTDVHSLVSLQLTADPAQRISAVQLLSCVEDVRALRPLSVSAPSSPSTSASRRKSVSEMHVLPSNMPPPAAPEKKEAKQLDPHSIAARRLAERKGRSGTSSNPPSTQQPVVMHKNEQATNSQSVWPNSAPAASFTNAPSDFIVPTAESFPGSPFTNGSSQQTDPFFSSPVFDPTDSKLAPAVLQEQAPVPTNTFQPFGPTFDVFNISQPQAQVASDSFTSSFANMSFGSQTATSIADISGTGQIFSAPQSSQGPNPFGNDNSCPTYAATRQPESTHPRLHARSSSMPTDRLNQPEIGLFRQHSYGSPADLPQSTSFGMSPQTYGSTTGGYGMNAVQSQQTYMPSLALYGTNTAQPQMYMSSPGTYGMNPVQSQHMYMSSPGVYGMNPVQPQQMYTSSPGAYAMNLVQPQGYNIPSPSFQYMPQPQIATPPASSGAQQWASNPYPHNPNYNVNVRDAFQF